MNKTIHIPIWAALILGTVGMIFFTSAYNPYVRLPKQGAGILLDYNGDSITVSFSGRLSYFATSAGTLTMGDTTIYTFNGTTATWTLPPLTAFWNGKFYVIKNKGTGMVTMNSNSGGNDIFDDVATNVITLLPGETYTIFNDGTHWCTKP